MPVASSMPEQVGSFKIIRRLGSGGFTEVYLAEDTNPKYLGDRVTVKRIRPDLFAKDPLFRRALVAEGDLGRVLQHPNVVQIYDLIEQDGVPYLVSEYVDGILLSDLMGLEKTPVEPGVAAEIARQICEGLSAIHQATDAAGVPLGVVHQDVRPGNIAINQRGDVKLLELGIARSKVMGQGGARVRTALSPYFSPEQVRGDVYLTPASDQYSVGVIVFELLSTMPFLDGLEALAKVAEQRASAYYGALPETEDSVIVRLEDMMLDEGDNSGAPFDSPPPQVPEARLEWARREMPRHLRDLERLPGAGLDEILGQMLAFEPAERYASAREAGDELLRWAWGMSGVGTNFRGYLDGVFARLAGKPAAQRSDSGPLDEKAILAAAESTFLPPRAIFEDSAFLPPPPAARTSSPDLLHGAPLEVAGPAPGAILDMDVGTPDEEPNDFKVKTDPSVQLQRRAREARKAEKAAAPVNRTKFLYLGAALLVVVVVVGALATLSSQPTGVKVEATEASGAAVAPPVAPGGSGATTDSGLKQMLAEANTAPEPEPAAMARAGVPEGRVVSGSVDAEGMTTVDAASLPDKKDPREDVDGGDGFHALPPEKYIPFVGKTEPGTGFLTVSTSPPGATVILDGINIEESPVTFESISAGEHQLILRSDDLGLRHVKMISIRRGQHWKGTWSFREKRWLQLE